MSGTVFHVRDLKTSYEGFEISDVDMRLESGDIMGLVGESGSGKSTVISTILGDKEADCGRIWVEVEGEHKALKDVIGFSPQKNALYPFMTVKENMYTFGRLRGMSSGQIDERMERLLRMMDIYDAADKRVSRLSGGMRKRADVSVSLLHRPEVAIFDEPFTGIDPPQREIIWNGIKQMARRGTIFMITSQNLRTVTENCNKYGLIENQRYYNHQEIGNIMEETDYRSLEKFLIDTFRL